MFRFYFHSTMASLRATKDEHKSMKPIIMTSCHRLMFRFQVIKKVNFNQNVMTYITYHPNNVHVLLSTRYLSLINLRLNHVETATRVQSVSIGKDREYRTGSEQGSFCGEICFCGSLISI